MTAPLWTAGEIAAATGGTVHGDFTATGVSIDTRSLETGDLFVATDELSNDPLDKGATRDIVEGARAAAGARAPFGTDPGWWDGIVARAGALADLVESPHADADQVVDLASALRNDLRPYI